MKFQTPKTFKELTVSQYVELLELNAEDFETSFDYKIERLAIVLDEDPETLEDNLTIEELTELNTQTLWVNRKPKGEFVETFDVYKFKKLEKLTLGEFIDLENLFSKGYYLNLKKILAILYRRFEVDNFLNEEFEPYKFDLEERAEKFNSFSMVHAQSIIEKYLHYREFFISKRKSLFKDESQNEESEESEEPKTREEIEEEKREKQFERWSWEFMIYKLCKGDLTKFEEVTELSLILVFNFEAMKKELNVKDF